MKQVADSAAAAASTGTGPLDIARADVAAGVALPGARRVELPAKLTVSRIAQRELEREADGAVVLPEAPAPAQAVGAPQPACLGAVATPDAAAVGTATHRLLAQVDFAQHTTALAVTALRDELLQRGLLEAPAAHRIDCAAVAHAARELAPLLLRPGAQLQRELPVALLIPAAEAARALGREPHSELAGETVYVQGVLDLLHVTEESALVLDFKTDRADAAQLLERYTLQLQWYVRAVRELLPQLRVKWALFGLREAGLVGPFDD